MNATFSVMTVPAYTQRLRDSLPAWLVTLVVCGKVLQARCVVDDFGTLVPVGAFQ